MNQKLTLKTFKEQYENVVAWNLVARNGVHDFGADAIARQTEYTRSEIQETLDALAEQDSVEVLDGMADIFVTMAYKHFLVCGGVVNWGQVESCIEFMKSFKGEYEELAKQSQDMIKEHLLNVARLVMEENQAEVFDNSSLCPMIDLINLVGYYYDVDSMDVVKHIMDSNWSKYSKVSTVDIDKEVAYISKKNQNFKDIVGTINADHDVVVFRSDNGAGKILKPSTFWNANCQVFL